jgi:hypothetical protein
VHEVACEKARNRTDKNVHFVRLGTEHFKVLILVRDTYSIGEGPLSCHTGRRRTPGHSIPDGVSMCTPLVEIFSLSSF